PTVAGAALPLDTEDTGTTERVEVEVATFYQSAPDGDSGDLTVAVNVGLLGNLEVSVVGTLAFDDPGDGGVRGGLGDSLLGVKYRFIDETAPWPALLARVTLQVPTGDEARGLGEGDVVVGLLLAASRTLGPVALTGNAGYTIATGDADADVVFLGASADWIVSGPWHVVGEVVGEVAIGRDADDVALIRVGFTWDIFDAGDAPGLLRQATLAGAVAAGLTSASPDVVVTLGVTLVY
ncbi:MAG: transporter, partial [Candidatus Rokuibacteriota bacterium]